MRAHELLIKLFPHAVDLILSIIDAAEKGERIEARRILQEAIAREAFEESMRARK